MRMPNKLVSASLGLIAGHRSHMGSRSTPDPCGTLGVNISRKGLMKVSRKNNSHHYPDKRIEFQEVYWIRRLKLFIQKNQSCAYEQINNTTIQFVAMKRQFDLGCTSSQFMINIHTLIYIPRPLHTHLIYITPLYFFANLKHFTTMIGIVH